MVFAFPLIQQILKTIPELIKFTLISYGANSIAKYLHADSNADFAIPTAT